MAQKISYALQSFDSTALAIAVDSDGKVYCGGLFTTYKGKTAPKIIKLNSNGSSDSV